MTFTLKIELENDAMQTAEDVARALRDLAVRLKTSGFSGKVRYPPTVIDGAKIMDENGNSVGEWEVS